MTLYFTARLLHIVGALGLFVALGVEWAGLFSLSRAGTSAEVRRSIEAFALSRRIGPPSMLSMLVPGLYMAAVTWGWQMAWIDASLASMIVVVVLGAASTGRRIGALERDAAAGEHTLSAELEVRTRDPWLWSSFLAKAGILLGIVLLMTMKPDLVGSLITMTVAISAGLASSLPGWLVVSPAANKSLDNPKQEVWTK